MSQLVWDAIGEHFYETGVSKGVLYRFNNGAYKPGVAWNGLTGVNEAPSGGEATKIYANNAKYLNLYSEEEFGATITAYTSPKEFDECDGTVELANGVSIGQQSRKIFGFCYRTEIGNDTEGMEHAYKINCVYGCQASPSARDHKTTNESPEAGELSWTITTTPVQVPGHKPTAIVRIDTSRLTTTAELEALAALEAKLYGTAETEAELPLPAEIAAMFPAQG